MMQNTSTQRTFFNINSLPPLLLLFVVIGCHSEEKAHPSESLNYDYYYEFDQVDWYRMEVDMDRIMVIYEDSARSESDDLLLHWALDLDNGNNEKRYLSDSTIDQLESIGFEKRSTQQTPFVRRISEVFKQRDVEEEWTTSCEPVFRDFIVFRSTKDSVDPNSSIVGSARICFECNKFRMYNPKVNTSSFGYGSEYKQLEALWEGFPEN